MIDTAYSILELGLYARALQVTFVTSARLDAVATTASARASRAGLMKIPSSSMPMSQRGNWKRSFGDDRRQQPLIILMNRNNLDYADVMITVITLMIPTRDISFGRSPGARQSYLLKRAVAEKTAVFLSCISDSSHIQSSSILSLYLLLFPQGRRDELPRMTK